jgi:hypothetical protein
MSNLYMTTEEFAAIIVDTLHEQNYFKKGTKNHPSDMAISFISTAETIAATMEWAIKKIHDINLDQKMAVLRTGNLSKNTSGSWSTGSLATENPTVTTKVEPALLKEGEPLITEEDSLGYSEWKRDGYL